MPLRINLFIRLAVLSLAGMLFSCQKEEGIDYDSFRLDLATCIIGADDELCFRLDNGDLLFPEEAVSAEKYQHEQRVMLNYVIEREREPLKKEYIINVRSVGRILSKHIVSCSLPEASSIGNDPLYLGTVWYGGGCINIRYKIEFNHLPHLLEMIYIPEEQLPDDTLRLQLRHDRNNDSPGFLTAGYASFRLPAALSEAGCTAARIKINSSNLPKDFWIVDLK